MSAMSRVLVVADSQWVINDVHAALSLPGIDLVDHEEPDSVVDAMYEAEADLVIVDFQVGTMGGMAVTRAVRAEHQVEGTPRLPVVLLLDRAADAFLAGRAGADAWVQKPFSANELRTAVERALTDREDGTA
jgi:CheY-like chemotaxis protein